MNWNGIEKTKMNSKNVIKMNNEKEKMKNKKVWNWKKRLKIKY